MLEQKLETALVALLKTSAALAGVPIHPGHSGQKMDGETCIIATATGLGGGASYAGYPEIAVQILVRTRNSDGSPAPTGDARQAQYVAAVRALLGVNSTSGPGPDALAFINDHPEIGCSCYCTDSPSAEARDEEKRVHGLAAHYRFWVHDATEA